ncbi:unnamed protein product [Paramecium pentaurelia]|uniref:Uncharacterized protein n=1 Tax=Paramecium pentaurelia TaxID=43138 RepID=A0A8S1SJ56_9CILI|nr:unnamed protein product [Paramecium pentaurelia]
MYRNSNYSFQEPKQKEIDFQAVDKLLEYTKQTHQNSQRHIKQPEYDVIEKQRNCRPNSLTQRISLFESNQQYKRERLSFQDIDFCKIVMFLMAAEIERLREQLQDNINQEQFRKNFEGMQSSINQWRLKFEQKEEECDQLREQLMNLKQINKENYEKNASILQLQIEKLKYEIQESKISQKEKQDEIDTLNLQLKQKQSQLDQFDNTIKQLKNEIQNLQNKHDIKYDQFIDELNNEIEILQQNYRKLYNDYQQYKQCQSQMYEQQTQLPYSRIQSQQQYILQENQEINMLNLMIQQLQKENTKLKDDLFKQSRRTETWCC